MHDLLEHLLVQGQLGDEALEASVLGLQLLEAAGLVLLEAAVLRTPAVQGLLADAEALADLGGGKALGQVGLGLAQLGDDFFGRVSLHDTSPGPAGPQRLSYHLDRFSGSRSDHYRPLWNELSAVDSVRLLFFAGNPPIEELGLPGDPLPDKPIYFRLERRGAKVRVAFSKDGSNWDPMEPPFHALDDLKLRRKVRVGVVVESTATGAFEVSFDQFKLTRLKDEEKKKKTRN